MKPRLLKAFRALKGAEDKHATARTEKLEKRAKRNQLRQETPKPEFVLEADEPKPEKPKLDATKKPGAACRAWFIEGIHEHIDARIKIGRWNQKRNGLAKLMVKDYGPEMTEKAIRYFCREWADIARRSRFRGLPTIELLWGMRDTIFGEVQLEGTSFGAKKDPVESDEFRDDAAGENPDVGWG